VRKKKLSNANTANKTVGINLVNPSAYFKDTAKQISKIPAIIKKIQFIKKY
jgi:hypothetical protein